MIDWFKFLDKNGAKKMSHKEIFDFVKSTKKLNELGIWKMNLFTTTYEWDRNIKQRGQRENGFEISASKVICKRADLIYQYWTDESLRKKWLKEKIEIRKTALNKSLVITWNDGTTVRVEFYKKSEDKTSVVVQHLKLPDFETSEKMKNFWKESINNLNQLLN